MSLFKEKPCGRMKAALEHEGEEDEEKMFLRGCIFER
jgi:hypothetical protein